MQHNVPFVVSLIVFIISPQPPLLKADILHPEAAHSREDQAAIKQEQKMECVFLALDLFLMITGSAFGLFQWKTMSAFNS